MRQEEKWFDKVRQLRKRLRRDIGKKNGGHNNVRKESGELLIEHLDIEQPSNGGRTEQT